ncbi:hypothetical protein [Anianabacter salinae]|uniref:hypothetical protein n=1 Tax=Anianabacter salinae TaxID=2851023 RepID=UPI00225E4824|nr:hypothetical protein [Anianabacter salinae]MBV0911602.1 hypothetical protein [Anianabacter salinae]
MPRLSFAGRLRAAFRAQPWLTAAFAVALALAVVFTGRAVLFAVYWTDPDHRVQAIEGWMTPRYVARSWHMTRADIEAALGEMMPPPGERLTLDEIAEKEGVPLEELIARIEAVAADRGHPGP